MRENKARGIGRSPEQGKKVEDNMTNRVDLAMRRGFQIEVGTMRVQAKESKKKEDEKMAGLYGN